MSSLKVKFGAHGNRAAAEQRNRLILVTDRQVAGDRSIHYHPLGRLLPQVHPFMQIICNSFSIQFNLTEFI